MPLIYFGFIKNNIGLLFTFSTCGVEKKREREVYAER